jgi:hypothetical protein
VNALSLIVGYGTPAQIMAAADDAAAGLLFGVWNTEGSDGVVIERKSLGLLLRGLGCGGLIAAARAHNIPVEIIVVSDGVGSHPNSRSYPPPRLRSVREQEAIVAAAELGVSDASVKFLRMSDKSMPSTGPQAEGPSPRSPRLVYHAERMSWPLPGNMIRIVITKRRLHWPLLHGA